MSEGTKSGGDALDVQVDFGRGMKEYADSLVSEQTTAKFLIGGMAALAFFVADFSSKALGNGTQYSYWDKALAASAVVSCLITIALCYWSLFFHEVQRRRVSQMLASIAWKKHKDAQDRYDEVAQKQESFEKINPDVIAIWFAALSGVISVAAFIMVLF